jgi:hypothetical protein
VHSRHARVAARSCPTPAWPSYLNLGRASPARPRHPLSSRQTSGQEIVQYPGSGPPPNLSRRQLAKITAEVIRQDERDALRGMT